MFERRIEIEDAACLEAIHIINSSSFITDSVNFRDVDGIPTSIFGKSYCQIERALGY